jgi:hypothetical protein
VAAVSTKDLRNGAAIHRDSTIEPGDDVRVCSGGQAGETGIALDVIWYIDQSQTHALVHMMSEEGTNHFFDLRMLEKVKGRLDKDLPSHKATWKHVK